MIQSGGHLKAPSTIWQGTTSHIPAGIFGSHLGAYGAIYRSHLWVSVLVNKIANATARLPLKVYERGEADSRDERRDHPYARLLRQPNKTQDPFLFWLWTVSTLHIHGEAFWGKVRDPGGRPVELVPLHPENVKSEEQDSKVRWSWDNGRSRIDNIDRRDLVHFRSYNPDSILRGLSPLEPLRATLENEDGARKANSALWRNGGRPSVFLTHPKTLSEPASKRIATQWSDLHGGVENWAKAAVLEEGMDAKTVALTSEELQYVEARKINREEACAVFDVPPPVVHILDRATFSNITEQMRSMYRDTMAPKLKLLESTLEFELRDGRFGRPVGPDFSEGIYSEFMMDEVLRGDYETRVAANATAIQTGQSTPAEVRQRENQPFIDGSDRLLVNAALVQIEPDTDESFDRSDLDRVNAVGQLIRAGFEPTGSAAALGLPAIPHTGLPPVTVQAEPLPTEAVRSVMGRLSRQVSLDAIDPAWLTAGLNGSAPIVRDELEAAKAAGWSVTQFRERLKALGGQ